MKVEFEDTAAIEASASSTASVRPSPARQMQCILSAGWVSRREESARSDTPCRRFAVSSGTCDSGMVGQAANGAQIAGQDGIPTTLEAGYKTLQRPPSKSQPKNSVPQHSRSYRPPIFYNGCCRYALCPVLGAPFSNPVPQATTGYSTTVEKHFLPRNQRS